MVTASILKNECGVQRFLPRDADLFLFATSRQSDCFERCSNAADYVTFLDLRQDADAIKAMH